jgi:hypothetical protein
LEEMRFFTLWHFYGGNCAMAWWVVAVHNFSAVAKNSLGGFCVLFRCRMNLAIIPTYRMCCAKRAQRAERLHIT